MGWPPPNTNNVCSDSLGGQRDLPNFCAPAGPAGDGNRRKFCEAMSKSEWRFKVSSGGCKYSWCDSYTRTTGGCMSGCCSIKGRGAFCQRIAFTADPATCCFNDFDFTNEGCIINPTPTSNSRTCDPRLRDITGFQNPLDTQSIPQQSCRTVVGNVCTNVDSPTFIQDWQAGGRCIYAVNRNLFGQHVGTISVLEGELISELYYDSARGVEWARDVVTKIVEELAARGKRIPSTIGDVTYTAFQPTFLAMSRSVPGIVINALRGPICAGFTAETISFDKQLTQLCGCYLAEEEYSRYTDVYGVSKECTPTCTIQGGVKVINEDGYTVRECDQDVCVIDNININLGNNNSDVNFSQVCGGCNAGASCRCFISGFTIDAASGLIGNIDFSQACGSSTVCLDNLDRPIDCDTGVLLDDDPLVDGGRKSIFRFRENKYSTVLWIMLGFIVLLVVLLIAVDGSNGVDSSGNGVDSDDEGGYTWFWVGLLITALVVILFIAIGSNGDDDEASIDV